MILRTLLLLSLLGGCVQTLAGQSVAHFKLRSGVNAYVIPSSTSGFDYYLIQSAGNAADQEHELGMSHLVEHLSFISSEHFPQGGLASLLSRRRINNNASTYQDKIVYYLKEIPADDRALNDSCLLVLHDWCGALQINDHELKREVGVITEEWRSGQRVAGAQAEFAHLLYNATSYERLSGLGKVEELQLLTADSVRRFIDRRFDPEHCAVVVKGPVEDTVFLRQKLERIFADIAVHEGHTPLRAVTIPDNDSTYFLRIPMPGNMPATIILNLRMEDAMRRDEAGFCRDVFYGELFNHLLERRLARYAASEESRIYDFKAQLTDLVEGYKQLQLELTTFPGYELREFRTVLGLLRDLVANGLTQTEREELMLGVEYGFQTPAVIVDPVLQAQNHFLRGYPLVATSDYTSRIKQLAAAFSAADFADYCRRAVSMRNAVVVAQNAARYDRILTRAALVSAVADPATVTPVDDVREGVASVAYDGKVSGRRDLAIPGGAVWTLPNGAGVVFRPTLEPVLRIEGFRAGGYTAFSEMDLPALTALIPLAEASGAGDYDRIDMERKAFVNGIDLSRKVDKYTFRTHLTAPVARTTEALEQLWLAVSKTRFDAVSQPMIEKAAFRASVENRDAEDQYRSMLDRELFGIQPSLRSVTAASFKEVTSEKLTELYAPSFGSARGWVYVVTGNLTAEQIEQVVKCIASLPSEGRASAKSVPLNLLPTQNIVKTVVYNTPDDNGGTDLNYVYAKPFTERERTVFELFARILRNRVNRTLREERGVIYGMYSEARSQLYPLPLSVVNINFGSRKGEQEPIAAYIDGEVSRMASEGVADDEIAHALAMIDAPGYDAQTFEAQCSGLWMSGQAKRIAEMNPVSLNNITAAEIGALAAKLRGDALIVRFVFK